MAVFEQLMIIQKYANMIGDYNSYKPRLYTEKLVGNIRGCMGFTLGDNGYYVPNTILNEDIRGASIKANKLIAIYWKKVKSNLYTNLSYLAKGIPVDGIKLPNYIREKIDEENLVIDFIKK